MKQTAIFIIVIFAAVLPVSGNLAHNQGECAFVGQCCDNCRSSSISIVKQYIVDSGAALINANSQLQAFLNKVELSELYGIDYSEMQNLLTAVIENMTSAEKSYNDLIEITREMDYSESAIQKLKLFDYDSYNGPFPLLWGTVKGFLENGDVKGAFDRTHSDCLELIESLNQVKSILDTNQLPITELRRVNQKFFETQLFAQYCAEVYAVL
jgi:hypothetical protein